MTDRVFVTERELAGTFDGGAYRDAYEIVNQYRQSTRYASRKNVKSAATANALDMPRGRLRTWIDDGGAPDAVNCIETARRHGWLNVTYEDEQFAPLNALVANVFSGGSITKRNYTPSFALNSRKTDSHVIDALDLVGTAHQLVMDRDGRADEARPEEDASALGRVLHVLGAPLGEKKTGRLQPPLYLEGAPDDVRRLFVVCYLENRAQKHGNILTFREDRSRGYLESLADLIADVGDGRVRISEKNVIISKQATENLGQVL